MLLRCWDVRHLSCLKSVPPKKGNTVHLYCPAVSQVTATVKEVHCNFTSDAWTNSQHPHFSSSLWKDLVRRVTVAPTAVGVPARHTMSTFIHSDLTVVVSRGTVPTAETIRNIFLLNHLLIANFKEVKNNYTQKLKFSYHPLTPMLMESGAKSLRLQNISRAPQQKTAFSKTTAVWKI